MFLRHPLTHLYRWHVFFTKCPRDFNLLHMLPDYLVQLRVVLTVTLAFSPSTHMTTSLPSPTHIPSCFSISHTLLTMAWFTVSASLTAPHSLRVKVIACLSVLPFLPRPRVGQPFGVRTPRFLVISHDVPFPLYSFCFVQFTSQPSESLFRCQSSYLCFGESMLGVNANSIVHVSLFFCNFFSFFFHIFERTESLNLRGKVC